MAWEKFIQSGFRMPFYMNLFIEGLPNIHTATGFTVESFLVVIERQLNTVYYDPRVLANYANFLKEHIASPRFGKRMMASLRLADARLLDFCQSLSHRDYQQEKRATLGKAFQNFSELFRIKFGLYGLPKLTDDALTLLRPTLFRTRLSDSDLSLLTKPEKVGEYAQERIALLTLVKKIRAAGLEKLFTQSPKQIIDTLGRFHPALYYDIETYVREYAWVPVTHHVQPMTLDHALYAIAESLKDRTVLKELDHLIQTQKKKMRRYALTQRDRAVLHFIRNLNAVNESRKAAMSKALLWSYPLFQAIADRLSTDVVSLRQLLVGELTRAIAAGSLSKKLRVTIDERLATYVCLWRNGHTTNVQGRAAKRMIQEELGATDYASIKEIHGSVAQQGKVIGIVRRILSEHQVENLKEGEILVTSMTDPDMVPAMKKAGAIVTDEGGITCHAAIVSRELRVPCVIGTKIATKVFKDGDRVEVDATRGIVRRIR